MLGAWLGIAIPIFKIKETNLSKRSILPMFDSKDSCDIIQMSNVQRQVGMRKGSKIANSTYDYGRMMVAEPGQDWLCWEEGRRQWQHWVEAAWVGSASTGFYALGGALETQKKQRDILYPQGQQQEGITMTHWGQSQETMIGQLLKDRRKVRAMPETQLFRSTQGKKLVRRPGRHQAATRQWPWTLG